MLGFGGTDKPTDPGEFRLKLLAQDVVEIVDKENPQPARAVAIAHDWGSVVLSRIAMYHPTRFVAYAWLAFGFLPPTPATGPIDLEVALAWLKQTVGVELYAYQDFLLKPEAAKLMETNIDSLIDMSFPEKAEHWQETMTTRGGMEDWITNNKRGPRASWLTEEYVQEYSQNLLRGGFDSPLNYYRCFMGPWNIDDENKLVETLETFSIDQPVFFGPALRDYVGLPSIQTPPTQAVANDLTIVEFDTGHWVYLELPDKVNEALDAWLSSKGL
ncbi:alpha/beta-hydrolase [Exidia glandulosa HHB12029]|uniref:Alpha/beta-hydrolase n=1 Tax=Exidia glandulosa HHB12029 TaxID=1314781 RepID=A0A165B5G9_EXIGL|nr:alpha/beta-hydrolase [Exidia glandulosa HHB12029]